jgi:multiple sugar transport system permease protein
MEQMKSAPYQIVGQEGNTIFMKKNFRLSLEKGDLLPTLLMLPAVLMIFCIMVVPLGYGLILSLCNIGFGSTDFRENFVGAANYLQFFKDNTAKKAIVNTLAFSLGATAGDLFFGTLGAVLLLKVASFVGKILRPILTIPLLVSPIIVGLIWRYIYDVKGILYWILGFFGIGINEFSGVTGTSTALFCTIVAHWWQVVPFVIIVMTAGLLSIPGEYYEAAYVDGAGEYKSFWTISFPLLKDVYMVVLLISGVDTLKVFDIIYSLTAGGPNNSTVSMSIYAYSQAFEQSNLSYAMALSFIAMIVTFLVFGVPFVRHNLKKYKE